MRCKECKEQADMKTGKIWLCKECYLKIKKGEIKPYDSSDPYEEDKYFGV